MSIPIKALIPHTTLYVTPLDSLITFHDISITKLNFTSFMYNIKNKRIEYTQRYDLYANYILIIDILIIKFSGPLASPVPFP